MSPEEFSLGSIATSTTLTALRQQIQTLIPSHPAPERQRILYGGRALVDGEQTIADALNTRRDVSQTEYVVHLLVKGEGQQSSGIASASGHRRTTSTPAPPVTAPGQQQQQQPVPGHVAAQPSAMPALQQIQMQQHQQMIARQMQMHVQQQQMMMQQQMRMGGVMPMPMQMPQAGVHMGPGFNQAVAQGQQQRAAMGMAGIGGHHQPPATHETHAQGQDAITIATNDPSDPASQGPVNVATSTGPAPTAPPQLAPPQQQQGIPRPTSGQGFLVDGVGPNGQRFQIHHHQQTFNAPNFAGPGQPLPQMPHMMLPQFQVPGMSPIMPFGIPGMPPVLPPQQMGQLPQQQMNASSALDRARENMVEMRRMLEAMRAEIGVTQAQHDRLAEMEQRAQSVNSYIDPLSLGTAPRTAAQGLPQLPLNLPVNANLAGLRAHPGPATNITTTTQQHPTDVTCYLLSSPQGPEALLFSPQHGTFNGVLPHAQSLQPQSYLQQIQPAVLTPNPAQPAAVAVDPANAANPAANAAAADPNGPLQQLLGHMWLLLRLLIFAYFLLGANLGWKRPLALVLIGLGFWMVRVGILAEGGGVRRWWDGIAGIPARPEAQAPADGQGDGQPAAAAARAGAMPTPEQVAQRLLNERRAPVNNQLARLRQAVRPVERVIALFVASLWPGIGEATVRAREDEARRVEGERLERERMEREEAEKARADAEVEAAGEKPGVTDQGEGSTSRVQTTEQGCAAKVEATQP